MGSRRDDSAASPEILIQALGSRKPLRLVERIPTPEEAFGLERIDTKALIFKIMGPATIALGIGIGSGEWLLGPAAAVKYGPGIMWIALLSALLQTVYNLSLVRLILVLGEVPIVYFKRAPGGSLWPALFSVMIVLWGLWGFAGLSLGAATAAGAMILGRVPGPAEADMLRQIAIGVMIACIAIVSVGAKIERTLEIANWIVVALMLIPLIFVIAPLTIKPGVVAETLVGTFSFGHIPPGATLGLLSAFWAYTALASGLNFMFINYYRDKGYGMGSIVGFIPAIIGGRKIPLSPVGATFRYTEENISTFKRWMRYVGYDQWFIFFLGAMLGMYLPVMTAVSLLPRGQDFPAWGVAVAIGDGFASIVGRWGFYLVGVIGFLVFFSSVLGAYVDSFTRNVAEGLWSVERVRRWSREDIRIPYYTVLAIYTAFSIAALWAAQPLVLIIIAANTANLIGLLAVPLVLYLNLKLPKGLRQGMWMNVLLIVFWIFSAFFFGLAVWSLLPRS